MSKAGRSPKKKSVRRRTPETKEHKPSETLKKKRRSLHFLVKQDEEAFMKAISTVPGFLKVFSKVREDPISIYKFQYAFLKNISRFRWIGKSRRVGGSWIMAAEALCRATLRNGHDAVFISYNLEDAKEKMIYVRELYEELPLRFRKELLVDSQKEMSFVTKKGRPSRIRSMPSKAPRGAGGDIYLDEIAHYKDDKKIYTGSTAVMIRGQGQLTMTSSPLGRRGIFWEIGTQALRPWTAYNRQYIHWWLCPEFCKNTRLAALHAPGMLTKKRVRIFGKKALIEQYQSLDEDDFKQEFELMFVDEAVAYFPYDLIIPNQTIEPPDLWEDPTEAYPKEGKSFGNLKAGFDVGRKRHPSVLTIVEEDKNKVCHVRALKVLEGMDFENQENEIKRWMDALPLSIYIDQGGIGMQLAENMEKLYTGRVIKETFTNSKKATWCGDFKIRLEGRKIRLPKLRVVTSHIHSIRKKISAAGNIIFDVDTSDKSAGHADIFWALAIATQFPRNRDLREEDRYSAIIIG